MNESDFIQWIADQPPFDDSRVLCGPGDDMAIVRSDRDQLLIACDPVLDGVHFDLRRDGPEAAGRKAIARNLSDIAAMAALPVGCVAAVTFPKGFSESDAQAIYRGLRSCSDEFGCPLVGGDVSSWDGPLSIHATVFACPAGATGGVKPVRRDGARAGQALFVTGKLGGSWRSDRHLTFQPRVKESLILAMRYNLRAMLDISDGLAKDLHRMCRASGCGATIDASAIPCHDNATLAEALTDGEDYELLFCVPNRQAERLERDDKIPVPVTRIGRMTRGDSLTLIGLDGSETPLADEGWEHTT